MDGTKYCVKNGCAREATEWSGKLIKSRDKVLAGWCNEHTGIPCPNAFNMKGVYGIYNKSLDLIVVSSDKIKSYD